MKDYVPLLQTALWVVLIFFSVLLLRNQIRALATAVVERVEQGAGFRAGPFQLDQLTRQLEAVKSEVADLNGRIIQQFLLTMSPLMYRNLKKLSSGRFGEFEKSTALEREIRHLRDLGYVDVTSVSQIPASGDELSEYVSITRTGTEFVRLRDEFERQQVQHV